MDVLDWIFAPLEPLVWRPDRIAWICALLFAAFVLVLMVRRFPPWPLLVASAAWGAFAVWESYAKAKGWNIRVDLFVIYPVLVILTAWGAFSIVRKR